MCSESYDKTCALCASTAPLLQFRVVSCALPHYTLAKHLCGNATDWITVIMIQTACVLCQLHMPAMVLQTCSQYPQFGLHLTVSI